MSYALHLTVLRVTEVAKKTYVSGFGGNAVYEMAASNWFVTFTGNIAICLGTEKPDLVEGDVVKLRIEKV